MKKILVTPRSFGGASLSAINRLHKAGFRVQQNLHGKIFTKEELMQEIIDVDGIIVGVDPLSADVLALGKKLTVVSKYGVGTDNIDVDFCCKNGIRVTVTENANTEAVADFTLSLMLACARRLLEIDKSCRLNDWTKKVATGLHGKTLGLVGLGNIGKKVVKRAHGFDMKILAYDNVKDEAFSKKYGISYVDLKTILRESDFISLHLPLKSTTRNIINKDAISLMKKSAIVINTARGGLIDEVALYEALRTKRIRGAGIDVFLHEPPINSPLFELDNIIVTSHSAASTVEAIELMSNMAVDNLLLHFGCDQKYV